VQPPPSAFVPPPPQRRSIWVWLGPLLAAVGIGGIVGMVALARFCGRAAEAGGVRVSNDIPVSALNRLEQKKMLASGEKVLAYYDVTLSGDGSELAMVTSDRLVYLKEGRTTALGLADIADVKHHEESLIGEVIDATGDSGEVIHIEVAPMNDGPLFTSTLESAWKKKRHAASP
jgi:hypothetical protein